MRLAVYSCYFGRHEPYNPAATGAGAGYDRVVFTDDAALAVPDGVRKVVLDAGAESPAALSRLPKLCPHRFLADYDWVVYVDNRALLLQQPLAMIDAIVAAHPDAPRTRYLFQHERTQCIYREIKTCCRMGYLDEALRDELVASYRAAGLPRSAGLFVNTVMIQRMGSEATDRFNEIVFDHVVNVTRRDQIGLAFHVWKQQMPAVVLSQPLSTLIKWPIFSFKDRRRFRNRVAMAHETQGLA